MATDEALQIVSVERMDGTEIIVEFSDQTIARYTTEQLLELQPEREKGGSGNASQGPSGAGKG